MEWKDLTVKKYYDVLDIMKNSEDDLELTTEIIDCIFNISSADLPYIKLINYCNEIQFLSTKYEPKTPKKEYIVNNIKFKPVLDFTKISTAQYVDYQTLYKQENWKALLNCLLVKDGENYGDSDYSDLLYENLSFTDYADVLFFFLKLLKNLTISTLTYSKKEMKKQFRKEKDPQKKKEILEMLVQIHQTITTLNEDEWFE